MPRKSPSPLIPIELGYLSADETREVSLEPKRVTPEELAELEKASADWWAKKPGTLPPPIIYKPSKAAAEQRREQQAAEREQERFKSLESLTDPGKLLDHCQEWRKRVLGPGERLRKSGTRN